MAGSSRCETLTRVDIVESYYRTIRTDDQIITGRMKRHTTNVFTILQTRIFKRLYDNIEGVLDYHQYHQPSSTYEYVCTLYVCTYYVCITGITLCAFFTDAFPKSNNFMLQSFEPESKTVADGWNSKQVTSSTWSYSVLITGWLWVSAAFSISADDFANIRSTSRILM